MPLTADQFAKALIAAGISTADEIKRFWSSIPAGERSKDGDTFAAKLIAGEKLSKFQADEILSGSATPLVLGDYVLLDRIGAGGMGQVFKAHHRRMDRLAAIKLLPPTLTKDEEAIKRFEREVKAAAKLSHPNIVQTYDAGVQKGVWYLVMEYVEGRDLAGVVTKEGPLPVERAADYMRQAAKGLAFAHSKGVIHRDIKPANLLLDKDGTVKILDMGLARIEENKMQQQEGLTQSGQVMGTVDYMAPEQAFNVSKVDGRADIYSLGCTLYRLITGRNLFDGESMVEKLMAHQTKPIPQLKALRADVPAALVSIFEKMVAKLPEDRYKTMSDVEAALAELLSSPSPQSPAFSPHSADPKLSAFFESMGGQKPATATVPNAAPAVDGNSPTISLQHPHSSTDPVSQRSIQIARENTPRPTAVKKKNQLPLLIGGGLLAAVLVALGIWVIIRGKDGKEIARVEVPEGAKVEIQQDPPTKPPADKKFGDFSNDVFKPPTHPIGVTKPTGSSAESSLPLGKWGLKFDGTGGNTVESVPVLALESTVVTIEAWLTIDTDPSPRMCEFVNTLNGKLNFGEFYTHHGQTPMTTLPIRQRIHLAGVNDGKQRRYYINGKLAGKTDDPGSYPSSYRGTKTPILIGHRDRFQGVVDLVRVSSVSRYDKDFTPPKSFTPDKETVALYLFDEGQGDTLKDSSGNNYHGKISGAKWVQGAATTSPTAVVYLDDLPEIAFESKGPIRKHGSNREVQEDLNWLGQKPSHSLFTHPVGVHQPAWVTYALDGRYAEFRTTVGASIAPESPLVFRIFGDDKPLWESKRQTAAQVGIDAVVDVRGVKVLKLEAFTTGSVSNAHALWINPRLTPVADSKSPNSNFSSPPPAVFPFDAGTALKHQEAWAKYLGVPVEFTNKVGMKFRLIPPGEFQMGLGPEFTDEELTRLTSPKVDSDLNKLRDARPAHGVRITRPFYMEVDEVTAGYYRDVVGQLRPEMEQDPNKVLQHYVAWPDAIAFCNKLSEREGKRPAYRIDGAQITPIDDADGYRLPTEAQWEYACRAGTNTLWYFGNDGSADRDTFRKQYAAPNPFGLTGLYGGSNETCWDATELKTYPTATPGLRDDPREDAGTSRIKRGGSGDDSGGANRRSINSFVRTKSFGGPFDPKEHGYSGFGRVVLPIASGPRTSVSGIPAANEVDLLALVDLSKDVQSGEWTKPGNEFHTAAKKSVNYRLQLPVDPGEEYSLRLEFTSDRGYPDLVLPFEGNGVPLSFDSGEIALKLAGPVKRKGIDESVNVAVEGRFRFADNVRHEVVIEVTRPDAERVRIAVQSNGKPALDWTGTRAQLKAVPNASQSAPALVFSVFLTKDAPTKLHEAKLTTTRGTMKPLRTAAAGKSIPAEASVNSQSAIPNPKSRDTALQFDGDDLVEVPTLKLDPKSPYTVEGFVTAPAKAAQGAGTAFGFEKQSYLDYTINDDWRWVYVVDGKSQLHSFAGAPSRQARTHIACVRDGRTNRLFVDGKLFSPKKTTKNENAPDSDAGESFMIGLNFRGLIDEVRISNVVRYKADFTPQSRFETDANTLALYHFDEATGDVLRDSSINKHHGRIIGAKWVKADGSAVGSVNQPSQP